jgi:aspartate aminotransferase-like enzyme
MDEWQLDVVVSGSQKGLMTAPGLAMAAVSAKGWKAVEASKCPKFYSDFKKIKKSIADAETPWTPAVSLCQSLNEALKMIKEETIEGVWARHRTLAKATRAGVQTLGFKLFSSQPCAVLTSAGLPDGFDGNALIRKMLEDQGVSIAGGQDHLKGKIFRLAHMGYMDMFDVMIGLTALEKTLTEMGYKVPKPGQATQAAKEAALVS